MAETHASRSPILVSLQMAKALALARRGNFKEAEATLAPGATPPTDLHLLHAYAALLTSAGDYSRALPLWRSLLEREPRHPEAERMIASIELWLSRPAWIRFVPLIAALVGALILLFGLLWALSDNAPTPTSKKPVPASAPQHSPITPVSPVRR